MGRERGKVKKLIEEKAENFSSLEKETHPVPGSTDSQIRWTQKNLQPDTIKMAKAKDRERILKGAREYN